MKTLLLTPALLLAGCVSNVAPPPLSSDHPASPQAAVAPLPATSPTLQSYEPIATAEPRPQMDHSALQGMDHGSMDDGSMKGKESTDDSMKGMDHSSMKGMESKEGSMKGMDHGSMKGMDHSAMKEGEQMSIPTESKDSIKGKPSTQGMNHGSRDHGTMKGMKPEEGSMKGMDHGDMKGMDHGAHWMAPEAAAARKNPVKADKASIARGQAVFKQNCAICHGAAGRGDGPAGAALNPKPADLAAMAGEHPDGDFAWKIENGRGAMPPWKGVLTQNQIWDSVNYIKSLGSAKAGSEKSGGGHDHSQHKH